MTQPSILVTGGTGFVGARLARRLVEEGHRVKVLARPTSSLRALAGIDPTKLEVVRGDVTIGHTVYRALVGCDRLFHVAAEFKMWSRRPADILAAAVIGTEQTLEAARLRGVEKVVVTSSTASLGATTDPTPLDENAPFNRENSAPYVVAKWKAERVALGYAERGMSVVVVNPATVLGPGDYKPTPSADLILEHLSWRYPFGMPYAPGGISLVDVDDVVQGHIAAMDKGRSGERYILGGNNVTFEQLFNALSEITGLAGPGLRITRGIAQWAGALSELAAPILGIEPKL
ncbi:MAG TPA: NAD-dependent epimerase/dehydratase family protein, partial [Polyangiaceae bacterium]